MYTLFTVVLLVLPVVPLHSEAETEFRHLSGNYSGSQAITSTQECPTWFTGNRSSGCECHEVPGIVCRSNYALAFVGSCMTYNAETELLQAASCPYSKALDKSVYVHHMYIGLPDNSLDVNDYFCARLNRTGVICSKCQTGLGPPVLSYSFKCVQCLPSPYGWLLYILLACFPAAAFSLLVFLFQVRANSPQTNLIVFACQYLALVQVNNPQQFIEGLGVVVATLYSLWNLDFFRYAIPPFCISEEMSLADVYVLEYVVATCPLFVILLIYVSVELHARGCKILVCLWQPFRTCCTRTRRWMDPRGSFVNVFAYLLTLSYTKLVIISLYVLRYSHLYSNNGEPVGTKVVYLDASMNSYSVKYLPYIFLSSFIIAFFVVLPALFLCLYPLRSFQRCLNRCGLSRHALHAFADSFNGYYKNGTDNSYDCRYFGSFYLVLRIVVFGAFVIGGNYRWLVQITTGVVAMFLLLSLRPYKEEIFNVMDSFIIGVWSLCILVNLYDAYVNVNIPLSFYIAYGLIPPLYIIALVILTLGVHTRFYHKCLFKFPKVRNLIERFVGYRSRDDEIVEIGRGDRNLAHRLVYPDEYRPLSYGATASSIININ